MQSSSLLLPATAQPTVSQLFQKIIDAIEPLNFAYYPELLGEPSKQKYVLICHLVRNRSFEIGVPIILSNQKFYIGFEGKVTEISFDAFQDLIWKCMPKMGLCMECDDNNEAYDDSIELN
jgi:hypothetical protein